MTCAQGYSAQNLIYIYIYISKEWVSTKMSATRVQLIKNSTTNIPKLWSKVPQLWPAPPSPGCPSVGAGTGGAPAPHAIWLYSAKLGTWSTGFGTTST